jgi:hypothetical protein
MGHYVALDDHKQMEAMKQVLQAFHLVYSADEYRVMEWDSDLIAPIFWQTKALASWKFLGNILHINATQSCEGTTTSVRSIEVRLNDPDILFQVATPSGNARACACAIPGCRTGAGVRCGPHGASCTGGRSAR